MQAFIDGLHIVRIESNAYLYDVHIKNQTLTWEKTEGYSQYFRSASEIDLHLEDKIWVNGVSYTLHIGVVTLTKAFDERFFYDGKLGVTLEDNTTIFRVFSPVAKEICVKIADDYYPMTYQPSGIYEAIIEKNLEGKAYSYWVRLEDQFVEVEDPYAHADYIIDFKKIKPIKRFVPTKNPIIYEAHVRDLTSGIELKNKYHYASLLEKSATLKGQSVVDYIDKLGVTYVQFLPVAEFFGTEDGGYNWGYNPKAYFKLSKWYASDSDDQKTILEFMHMVDAFHQRKIGVVMDVVFNHVYQRKEFPYDYLVPGYFYRHDENNQATDASFCGNDIETRRYMVRKLIIDALMYYTEVFKIDGFRFDLMGLIDVETIKIIEKALKKVNKKILLYGEGWHMPSVLPERMKSSIENSKQLPNIGFFNDQFRDFIKGPMHQKTIGLVSIEQHKPLLKVLLQGSKHRFSHARQSINYIECHDNDTFWDRLNQNDLEVHVKQMYQDLGNHIVLIAKGIPFIHAGSEIGRTKKGYENSYNLPDEINHIEYDITHPSLKTFKKLVSIRKHLMYDKGISRVSFYHQACVYTLSYQKQVRKHFIKFDFEVTKFKLKPSEQVIFSSQEVVVKDQNLYMFYPGVYIIDTL